MARSTQGGSTGGEVVVARRKCGGRRPHGAPGIDLVRVSDMQVRDCDVATSGRDINGDNHAIRMVDAERVQVVGCRLRSQYATGLMAWGTRDVNIQRTLVYESFQGMVAGGGRYRSDLAIRNCTVYGTNQHGGIKSESPSRVTVHDSLIVQMPSLKEAKVYAAELIGIDALKEEVRHPVVLQMLKDNHKLIHSHAQKLPTLVIGKKKMKGMTKTTSQLTDIIRDELLGNGDET